MTKEELKIIFFGTGPFAENTLKYLIDSHYRIVAIVTMGQNRVIANLAKDNGINLLVPKNLMDESFIHSLKELNADLQVVVSFKLLPEMIWSMPKYGTFNCHFSLLPNYRGAAPIEWSLINGEKETGVTTFFIDNGIDTGKIILQAKTQIDPSDNFYSLGEKLSKMANSVVRDTINLIIECQGQISPTISNDRTFNKAPKITDEMCQIDFSKTFNEMNNWYKGMIGHNIWCNIKMKDGSIQRLKVLTMSILPYYGMNTKEDCGKQILQYNKGLSISIDGAYISLLTVQIPGKNAMPIKDFLNGYKNKIAWDEILK